ncbi:glycoside hydrolase family protein [Clostridium botulinum]|uniref:Lysozyme n=1 Tax=Clostridium botulinum TaxID=1491 RepID=A0A6B4JHZ1_CLOBO|nr:lysozyme [Clostridium botulinum]EES48384.1 phage lysozyme [Clostridium botulinum E1 str. 'BoNT E Beluga']MBY6759846.1 glycoside hydrolase family protein [Clostridium botulinum]MBY6918755.1 glycoside hydrolase family protein [Clostridium botulinum]MCR1129840.1 glycoside hydrolase family protein [Clostridium botulinum]NFH67837.1 cell wall-binding protein [Clostridium botulinum]
MTQWKWCVEGQDGKVIKGWYEESGNWYYLNDEGVMQTGWVKDKDELWYYMDYSGVMQTGWIELKGGWYYLEESSNGYKGKCYIDCTATINGKQYTFDKDGHMLENSLVSEACINFIKSWEGFFAKPYYDMVGVLTLGYGMTGDEIKGLSSITESKASDMLKDLINNKYAQIIKKSLDDKNISLKQNEFDALVSFAYNCGTAGLLGSTLYKNIVAGIRDKNTIISNFQAWSNGGGKRIEGLYRRRMKEAAMFLDSDYTGNV